MPALSTWAPEDGLLGAVAPLALATTQQTALVVDLDLRGPRYPGGLTLARLVADGPRRSELEPRRRGVAVLRNGGVAPAQAGEVLEALISGWPAVVVRLPANDLGAAVGGVPVVPFRPLLPAWAPAGPLLDAPLGACVWQSAGWRVKPPTPGPVLPRPGAGIVAALLNGVRPPKGRWLRSFRQVWEYTWR